MSDKSLCQRSNRISVCPLSTKIRKMKSSESQRIEESLVDVRRGEQAYAVRSYSGQRHGGGLIFLEGDVITVLERFPDGMYKGYISRLGSGSKIGIFPSTCVVPFTKHNVHSFNAKYFGKTIKKQGDLKVIDSSVRDHLLRPPIDGEPMYSCNCIGIRKSPNHNSNKANLGTDALNRGSTCSVDSGRGSATATIVNNIKVSINSISAFDQTQHIRENCSSHSIESGLASYQRQSSSSSSSIGCESSNDGSKPSGGFTGNQKRQNTNRTSTDASCEENIIKSWLQRINLESYLPNFIGSGYDFNTALRMTPEDLNAIGITNPMHRQLIKQNISNSSTSNRDSQLESIPGNVEEWLTLMNLDQYSNMILQQGYDSIEKVTELTWEDLEEIGIRKLGHQKKITIAVEKLKKLIKNSTSDKMPISYSAENFRDQNSRFKISDISPNLKLCHDAYESNPSYLDLSKYSTSCPIPPIRKISQHSDSYLISTNNPLFSPIHKVRPNLIDSAVPPPTPKRISSIVSNSQSDKSSSRQREIRKPYENLDELFEIGFRSSKSDRISKESLYTTADSNSTQTINSFVQYGVRNRGTSVMMLENPSLPFANENCGTIKQRSSSLDRTNMFRGEIGYGLTSLKTNILTSAKSVLPLNLPYSVDSVSHKAISSTKNIKVNLDNERNFKIIPSDVHIAAREKVPLPKLHIEDNSSNEDFNEICDMLEDLTELLDKEASRNH